MNTVSAADYHEIVQVQDPRISPDGERVAFVRKVPEDDESYEETVCVVSTDGDGDPRQFTVAEGVDSQPRWSPSGDRLAFASTRGGDDDRPQLWVLPTDGGEARQVTDVVGGVSEIAWSPDGTRIAFVQSTTSEEREEGRDLDLEDDEYEREPPDPRVIDRMVYRAHEEFFDGRRTHVYVADVTGEDGTPNSTDGSSDRVTPVRRLTDGDHDHERPAWGDDATLYYGVRRTGDPDDNILVDLVAHDLDSGETETVTRTASWELGLAATADGRLAYTYTEEERATLKQVELEVIDRASGEVVTPTASFDRTVTMAARPQWGPVEESLYFSAPDEGDVGLWRVPGDASADPEPVVDEGYLAGATVGEDAVAFVRSAWDHPDDVFLATLGEGETRRLTRVNADLLDGREIAEPQELRFPGGDGDEIQGWLLTPPDFDPGETYPLAVEIHGGPHAMWSTAGTMWHEFQLLAARGYVVFWCNPRGSTGYGEAFMAAVGDGRWGSAAFDDVMAGVDEVAARDYVDEEDAFVTGGSYGGYMTAWTVGHTDRFSAAVAQRGVYELNSFYGSTDAFKLIEWDFGATPWEDPEFLWEQSPVAYAHGVETPTLLIHSDHDYRVPVNNAEMLYLLFRKNGVETRLVRYPREGHELSRSGEPGHVVDRLERIVRWFDGYSTHRDVPKALERGDEGLSAEEDDEAADGD